MLALKYARRWQIAGVLLLVVVLAAAMMPDVPVWDDRDSIFRFVPGDKVMHFLTFALLAIWFSGQYARPSYWRILLGLLAFGSLIELCQGMVDYRTAEGLDLLADGIGVAAGLGIALLGAGGWSQRLELRMSR